MLDFNRRYYDEMCGSGGFNFSMLEHKPGKYEKPEYRHKSNLDIPQSFNIWESNADEKRSGPCRRKTAEEILNCK